MDKKSILKAVALVLIVICAMVMSIISLSKPENIEIDHTPPVVEEYGEKAENPIVEIIIPDLTDVMLLARTMYGECRGVPSDMEKAAVAWVILNRIDAGYASTVEGVVTAPNQFKGYNSNHPLRDDLMYIAEDVLIRWHQEKAGHPDVGRVIPEDYYWFNGSGDRNYFRNEYEGSTYWDWSLENPYES